MIAAKITWSTVHIYQTLFSMYELPINYVCRDLLFHLWIGYELYLVPFKFFPLLEFNTSWARVLTNEYAATTRVFLGNLT